MDTLEAVQLKTTTFGALDVAKVKSEHADALYKHLLPAIGKRQAAYCMQVARRCWFEWLRDNKGANPFSRMNLDMKAEQGNRPTSRAEYDMFRAQAREMGMQSMATAAALSFELIRRVSDVFGFIPSMARKTSSPAGSIGRITGRASRSRVRQHKTGKRQSCRCAAIRSPTARIRRSGEKGPPALSRARGRAGAHAARRAGFDGRRPADDDDRGPRRGGHGQGRRYTELRRRTALPQGSARRLACPEGMTPTGFRHGGATELGDAVVAAGVEDPDLRPITGHATREMVDIYNKVTIAKARALGTTRRGFVEGQGRE
jgi:hypothetical protein